MSVFNNDPFSVVHEAFCNLFPDLVEKVLSIEWVPEIKDEDGCDVCGCTTFLDDGKCLIEISAEIPVSGAIETLAHELSHVAAGEAAQHGPEWEDVFDRIQKEYDRIMGFQDVV